MSELGRPATDGVGVDKITIAIQIDKSSEMYRLFEEERGLVKQATHIRDYIMAKHYEPGLREAEVKTRVE